MCVAFSNIKRGSFVIKHLNILNLFLFVGIFILLISLYQEYAAMGTVNIENVGGIGEDTREDKGLKIGRAHV